MPIERTRALADVPTPAFQAIRGWRKASLLVVVTLAAVVLYIGTEQLLSELNYVALGVYVAVVALAIIYALYFYRVTAKTKAYVLGTEPDEPYGGIRSGWRRALFVWELNVLIAAAMLLAISLAFRQAYEIWGERLFKVNVADPTTLPPWPLFVFDQFLSVAFLGLFEVFGLQTKTIEPVFPLGSAAMYLVRVLVGAAIFLAVKHWYDTSRLIKMSVLSLRNSFDLEAEERLKKLGSRAVPALIKWLKANDDWIRRRVTEILGRIGDSRAATAIYRLLSDQEAGVRAEAIESLTVCGGGREVPKIRTLIDDREAEVREAVVTVLAGFKDRASVPVLMRALEDQNQNVREKAARSLAILLREGVGSSEDVEELLRVIRSLHGLEQLEALSAVAIALPDKTLPILEELRDSSEEDVIRIASVELIYKIRSGELREDSPWRDEEERDEEAEETESEEPAEPYYSDSDLAVAMELLKSDSEDARDTAVSLLGVFRDKRAIPVLLEALSASDPMVRAQATSALGDIGDPGTAAAVARLLRDSEADVRKEAADALDDLEAKDLIEDVLVAYEMERDEEPRRRFFSLLCQWDEGKHTDVVLAGLNDQDEDIRKSAIEHFKRRAEPRAIPRLLELLTSEDNEFILSYIIEALLKAGDPSVVPHIDRFCTHSSEWVRRAAEYALAWFKEGSMTSEMRIDEVALYEKLRKYPFFRAWQDGKLSRELFQENMEVFKQDFFSDGISPGEYVWVLEREIKE